VHFCPLLCAGRWHGLARDGHSRASLLPGKVPVCSGMEGGLLDKVGLVRGEGKHVVQRGVSIE
jgi:hypothetical protein